VDLREIKQLAIALRATLRDNNIRADCIVLFGSYSRGEAHQQSDIDLAVISGMFGQDRFTESSLLNRLAVKIHPDIEAVPIGLKDFLTPSPLSPLLHEIKTKGTILI
jgi:predicted nucleotidyltransferase